MATSSRLLIELMVVLMPAIKLRGGCVDVVLKSLFKKKKSLLQTNYRCELIFKTVAHIDFCHKMTEALLQNRQRVAPSRRPSDIRLLAKDGQLQPSHRGVMVWYIFNNFVQPSKDGMNLKWPLIVKAAPPDAADRAIVLLFLFSDSSHRCDD